MGSGLHRPASRLRAHATSLRKEFSPAVAGCRYRGPLTPRLARPKPRVLSRRRDEARSAARPTGDPVYQNRAAKQAEHRLRNRRRAPGVGAAPAGWHGHLPGDVFLVLGPLSLVLCPWSFVLGPLSLVLCPLSLVRCVRLGARGSWLAARGSWLVARGSGLVARGSWLVARGSGLVARGSWLGARGSLRIYSEKMAWGRNTVLGAFWCPNRRFSSARGDLSRRC